MPEKKQKVRGIPARMKRLERRQRRTEKALNTFVRDTASEIDELVIRVDKVENDVSAIKAPRRPSRK